MQNHPENPWEVILKAAQAQGSAGPQTPPAEPPSERFVDQVRTMRSGLWEFARLMLWRRCSVIFAAVAIVLYALCHLLLAPESPRLIPTPPKPSLPLTR